jgi:hypothetical protein
MLQVMGRKYIRLYAPDQSELLYAHSDTMLSNTSEVWGLRRTSVVRGCQRLMDSLAYGQFGAKVATFFALFPFYVHFVYVSFGRSFWGKSPFIARKFPGPAL